MAKESSAARKKAGRKAWAKRKAKARAEGKTRIKVGKHFVDIGGKAKAKAKSKSRPKRKRAKRSKASPKRARTRTRRGKRSVVTKQTRTRTVRLPGKTRTRTVTKVVTRRAKKGALMENPLTGGELFAGALTMLLGLGVADLTDRMVATHALQQVSAASGTAPAVYADPVNLPAGQTPATALPAGTIANGAAVLAPMNLKRWAVGGVVTVVPFVAAAFVKHGAWRSALQLFGFGAGARVLGKGAKDGLAYLLRNTQTGQRVYVDELRAGQLNAMANNNTTSGYLVNANNGNAPNAFPAPGLGRQKPGHTLGCGCSDCCNQRMAYVPNQTGGGVPMNTPGGQVQPPAPPPQPPPALAPPGTPVYAGGPSGTPAYAAPQPPAAAGQPAMPSGPTAVPGRPNIGAGVPFNWLQRHHTSEDGRHEYD